MQHSHLALLDQMINDFRYAGAPDHPLRPLKAARRESAQREGAWYENAEHFMQATQKALEARGAVISSLLKEGAWKGLGGDIGARMRAVADLMARFGQASAAVELFRLSMPYGEPLGDEEKALVDSAPGHLDQSQLAIGAQLLKSGQTGQGRSAILESITKDAAMAKALVGFASLLDKDKRVEVGEAVIVYDEKQSKWRHGKIALLRPGGLFDISLGKGEEMRGASAKQVRVDGCNAESMLLDVADKDNEAMREAIAQMWRRPAKKLVAMNRVASGANQQPIPALNLRDSQRSKSAPARRRCDQKAREKRMRKPKPKGADSSRSDYERTVPAPPPLSPGRSRPNWCYACQVCVEARLQAAAAAAGIAYVPMTPKTMDRRAAARATRRRPQRAASLPPLPSPLSSSRRAGRIPSSPRRTMSVVCQGGRHSRMQRLSRTASFAASTNSSAIARASFTRTSSFPATRAAALGALECQPATEPPPESPPKVVPQHTLASNPDYA